MTPRVRGLLWAALAVVIWGGFFVVTRLGVTGRLAPVDVVALRFAVGALVLLPAFLPTARRLPARGWAEGAVLAICWGPPFVLLLAYGLRTAHAGFGAALTPGVMPVFAGLLGWWLLGARPGRRQWAGYAVILAALALLGTGANGGAHPWESAALLLAASVLWALYTVRVRRSGLPALQAAALVCVISAAVTVPACLLSGASRLSEASWTEIGVQAFYQGVLVSGVSVVAFNRAVALLGPAPASAIASLVPVVATVLAVPVLGEIPGPREGLAVAGIAAGVFLAAGGAGRAGAAGAVSRASSAPARPERGRTPRLPPAPR